MAALKIFNGVDWITIPRGALTLDEAYEGGNAIDVDGDAVIFQGGTGTDTDNIFEGKNNAGSITASLAADGDAVFNNIDPTGVVTILDDSLVLRNPADTFGYIFSTGAIAANRTVSLPVLTANGTFAFLEHGPASDNPQVWTGFNEVRGGAGTFYFGDKSFFLGASSGSNNVGIDRDGAQSGASVASFPALAATATFAMLEIQNTFTNFIDFSGTTHAGLHLQQLTNAQRNALTPVVGMVIYNTTNDRIQGRTAALGGSWENLDNDVVVSQPDNMVTDGSTFVVNEMYRATTTAGTTAGRTTITCTDAGVMAGVTTLGVDGATSTTAGIVVDGTATGGTLLGVSLEDGGTPFIHLQRFATFPGLLADSSDPRLFFAASTTNFVLCGVATNQTAYNATAGHIFTGAIFANGALSMGGTELLLDADLDTSITADTDDQIDFKIGAVDDVIWTGILAHFNQAQSGMDFRWDGDGVASALILDATADTAAFSVDTTFNNEVKGSKVEVCSGGDNGSITGDAFLKGFNGQLFTATRGVVQAVAGSVTEIGVSFNVSVQGTPGTIDFEVRNQSSTVLFTAQITTSGTGDTLISAAQARDTGGSTFAADDILTCFVNFGTFVGTILDIQMKAMGYHDV